MKKVYISGPISGIKNNNKEAFDNAESYLRNKGYEVCNPLNICSSLKLEGLSDEDKWIECMRFDITMLLDCDGIFTLPGWQDSKGAILEVEIASNLNFEFISYTKQELEG